MVGIQNMIEGLGDNVSRKFGGFRQYAKEVLGTAKPLTILPEDYYEAKQFVENTEIFTESVKAISTRLIACQYENSDKSLVVINDFARNVQDKAQFLASTSARAIGITDDRTSKLFNENTKVQRIPPKPFGVAFQEICKNESVRKSFERDEALSSVIDLLSRVEDHVTERERTLCDMLNKRVLKPIEENILPFIKEMEELSKTIESLRLDLDGKGGVHPNRLTSADGSPLSPAAELLKNQLDGNVENYKSYVKTFVSKRYMVEVVRNLAIAQVSYFSDSSEALAELMPEVDEIVYMKDDKNTDI